MWDIACKYGYGCQVCESFQINIVYKWSNSMFKQSLVVVKMYKLGFFFLFYNIINHYIVRDILFYKEFKKT